MIKKPRSAITEGGRAGSLRRGDAPGAPRAVCALPRGARRAGGRHAALPAPLPAQALPEPLRGARPRGEEGRPGAASPTPPLRAEPGQASPARRPRKRRALAPCPPPPCIVGRQQQSQDGGQQEADEGNSQRRVGKGRRAGGSGHPPSAPEALRVRGVASPAAARRGGLLPSPRWRPELERPEREQPAPRPQP